MVSIIGPNGAGKTTFFNTLTGIYKPEDGQITFDGHSLVGLRPDQITSRGIARTFQNIRLFGSHDGLSRTSWWACTRTCASRRLGALLHSSQLPQGRAESSFDRARAADGLCRPDRRGRRAGPQPALRRAAPGGDRPRPGLQTRACCCWMNPPPG